MYYITFIDQPTGVYQTQVIDVVNKINSLSGKKMQLVAFFPWQKFKENSKKIKDQLPNAIVLPIIFGTSRWRWTKILMHLYTSKKRSAMIRGPLATSLGLGYYRKIVFDCRAALKAEIEEFGITNNPDLDQEFIDAEKQSVLFADFKIAVSNELVHYWKLNYKYQNTNHLIIPSTLTPTNLSTTPSTSLSSKIKVVYSGGTGGWQSFDLVVELLENLLDRQPDIEVIFLTKETKEVTSLCSKFPNRCERKWLKHHEVYDVLSACDYGILLRDDQWTNRVASPVKYAEYLNAGLRVLISPHIGDFSNFTVNNNAGLIIKDEIPNLDKVSKDEKNRLIGLSDNFSKSNSEIEKKYLEILSYLK